MKTFRKYLNECSFGEIWDSLAEFFGEPEAMRAVYSDYYDKLKALPEKRCKGVIELSSSRPAAIQPEGMNAAPDWLIDKKVKTTEQDSAYVSAVLLYWASLHTFYTSKEHDDDLNHYLDIIDSDDPKALGQYLMESMNPGPLASKKRESINRKERQFWEETFTQSSPGDWRGILYVLKRKLEYDMGFMRGYADHAGREHDADRMKLCCRLIDGATVHINPDQRALRMLSLLFKVLEQNITKWDD